MKKNARINLNPEWIIFMFVIEKKLIEPDYF